ncbi:gliding motility-associated C-terminal domain-containing protein [Sediminibacterium soli]|uniref:gliding motility-associated C-terminal domain-containing protein n=1 Tax=Sediminibacterium soli TaxID=2698829 RepID=UPI00137AE424|nr:gliding motility-associated C-terminal domain-containing protein [Sediminibacterium soli]
MRGLIWICLPILFVADGFGQGLCPANIGFENGSFSGWQCYAGDISNTGSVSMQNTQPINGIHTLYQNTAPQVKDTFGGFPVNCPNGSGYSIKLGHGLARGKAQAVTYTFTIPPGQNDYSLIFNYAVVLQNPADHLAFEQPQFTSKVFDVSANKYLECGSFQFIAAPNLPGFKESPVEKYIYYKDWAPVTIRLSGMAGKTIRLEFTVTDCTKKVHFGYAYIDVDENCTTPVTGNTYCNGTDAVVLKAPYGFKEYKWFDEASSTLIGTGNTLRITPPPVGNTKYRLEIVPFPNQGCYDTIETKIIALSDFMLLKVKDTVQGCVSPGADIANASVTAGSTPGLRFQYFTDSTQAALVANPAAVTREGGYYIHATAGSGCTDIKPVYVQLKKPPLLVVSSPVCEAISADLTQASVTAGSEARLVFTYWQDTTAVTAIGNPAAITASGKYFIRATNTAGCNSLAAVAVTIGNLPGVVLADIHSCGELLFSNARPAAGSNPSAQITYWQDAALSVAVTPAQVFSASGTIYARAVAVSGCSLVKPLQVLIHENPAFLVNDPPPVTRPATVDLQYTISANIPFSYSYWHDDKATRPVESPHAVTLTGRYYIRGSDQYGCVSTKAVTVQIIDPPVAAPNAFSPNNDGVNDTWQVPILSAYSNCTVDIYTRDGRKVFSSTGYSIPWNGKQNGRTLPTGTYYYVIRLNPGKTPVSGSVTIVQ